MPLIEIKLQVQLRVIPKIRPFGFSLTSCQVSFFINKVYLFHLAFLFSEELTCSLFATRTSFVTAFSLVLVRLKHN